jgi:prepilin-type N-terminal cleavage/methylation domain-containing protein
MSTSSTGRRTKGAAGFTLLEIMMAITILAVGMLALAAVVSKTSGSTDKSRYMSMANQLTSAKIEELTRLPVSDTGIQIASGDSAGSLTANTGPVTVGAATVIYYDEVYLSSGGGKVQQTTYEYNKSTATYGYFTQLQTPDAGTPASQASNWSTTPPSGETSDMIQFERRWLIEDSTLTGLPAGVRRITVRVCYPNCTVNAVTFQMSTVRQ